MSAWDKFEFWKDAFRKSAPMMVVSAWVSTNACREWTGSALAAMTPHSLADATSGSGAAQDIAEALMRLHGAGLAQEISGDLGESQVGSFLLLQVETQALYSEATSAVRDLVAGSPWWEANSTEFRRECARYRAARKVLGS